MHLCNPIIKLNKIKKYSLFKINGFPMHISGRHGKQLIFYVAGQLCLDEESIAYLKKAFKYESDLAINEEIIDDKNAAEENKQKAHEKLGFYENTWGISDASNMRLYDILIAKSANNFYKNRPASQTSVLKQQRDKFAKLPLSKQIRVINEAINIFKCASATADFKLLEKGSACGKIQVSTNITKCKQCILINQSPTGVFEQEVDLMKL